MPYTSHMDDLVGNGLEGTHEASYGRRTERRVRTEGLSRAFDVHEFTLDQCSVQLKTGRGPRCIVFSPSLT